MCESHDDAYSRSNYVYRFKNSGIFSTNWEKVYVHRKIEFVTVNQNSLNYGGGKIFHSSVVKVCFVLFCVILIAQFWKQPFIAYNLRIMSGPAGIRLQSILSGCPAGEKFFCPVNLYKKVSGHFWLFCKIKLREIHTNSEIVKVLVEVNFKMHLNCSLDLIGAGGRSYL